MVDTNFSLRYNLTYNNIPAADQTQQVGQEEKIAAAEEILGEIYVKMLNEQVAQDPEWAELSQKLADQGQPVLQMYMDEFGIDFTELAANAAPDIFVPASMRRELQQMADAVLELTLRTLSDYKTKNSLLVDDNGAQWKDAAVQFAMNLNAEFIDTSPVRRTTVTTSMEVNREIKTTAPMGGTFNVQALLTTSRNAPAERPRYTQQPRAATAVTYENYRSTAIQNSYLEAKKAAAGPTPSQVEFPVAKTDISASYARNVSSRFASFVAEIAANGVPVDVHALIQWVLRQAYLEGIEQLVYTRDKVALANAAKKALRQEMTRARSEQSRILTEAAQYAREQAEANVKARQEAKTTAEEDAKENYPDDYSMGGAHFSDEQIEMIRTGYINNIMYEWDKNNALDTLTISKMMDNKKDELTNVEMFNIDMSQMPPKMVANGQKCDTAEKLENYISELENKLSSITDDSQLANTELQSLLEKDQEVINTLSNIGKLLHDTAMAIIRKIG